MFCSVGAGKALDGAHGSAAQGHMVTCNAQKRVFFRRQLRLGMVEEVWIALVAHTQSLQQDGSAFAWATAADLWT